MNNTMVVSLKTDRADLFATDFSPNCMKILFKKYTSMSIKHSVPGKKMGNEYKKMEILVWDYLGKFIFHSN